MKTLNVTALLLALFATQPVSAGYSIDVSLASQNSIVQHSGGCRKDSPRGQCCHAGSKPYHCH